MKGIHLRRQVLTSKQNVDKWRDSFSTLYADGRNFNLFSKLTGVIFGLVTVSCGVYAC